MITIALAAPYLWLRYFVLPAEELVPLEVWVVVGRFCGPAKGADRRCVRGPAVVYGRCVNATAPGRR